MSDAHKYWQSFFASAASMGLRHVVVSPGARSAALALSAASVKSIKTHICIDERSAGFIAVGIAKTLRKPVGLVCTSGSAAANYSPAVTEAFYSRVPLLLLTADRPPELRNWGAGQTINQMGLYGQHLVYEEEMPVGGEASPDHAVQAAKKAVILARQGPVHLNCPFREPLEPESSLKSEPLPEEVSLHKTPDMEKRDVPDAAGDMCSPAEASLLAGMASENQNGILHSGPDNFTKAEAEAVLEFCKKAGWPILADAGSSLRSCESDIVATTHGLWLSPEADPLAPEQAKTRQASPSMIVHIGGAPVAKGFRKYLEQKPAPVMVLCDPKDQWEDPSFGFTHRLESSILGLFGNAAAELKQKKKKPVSSWLKSWQQRQKEAAKTISTDLENSEVLSEPELAYWTSRSFSEISSPETGLAETGSLEANPLEASSPETNPRKADISQANSPDGNILFLANSMPIRDFDLFGSISGKNAFRTITSRGTNGIDGNISQSLGMAHALKDQGPTQAKKQTKTQAVLYCGDLCFLHDVSSLILASAQNPPPNLIIVVANNNGGGIFSSLPMAEKIPPQDFEDLFTTPPNVDISFLKELPNISHCRPETSAEFQSAFKKASTAGGLHIIEVLIENQTSITRRKELRDLSKKAA